MEEYRRDARNAHIQNEALQKENETLKYRIEEVMSLSPSPRELIT